MKRRLFLKVATGLAGGYGVVGRSILHAQQSDRQTQQQSGELPRRVLGRTGQRISVVGFPGLALAACDQRTCTDALHRVFDNGVNYFDVAPAYGDAEIKMGIGLQGIDRSRIFLACKTKMRDKDGAQAELDRSLQRLKTDYFDLYQMHAVFTPEEAKRALGAGGAIETFQEAKEQGKIKHIGFSAHTTKGALELMNGFRFDTVMFAINFVEYFTYDFGKAVLELASQQGAAVLAMKATSGGAWPQGAERTRKWWYRTLESDEDISLALRFALSQKPVAAAITPSFIDLFEKAVKAAKSYRPITEPELEKLKEMAKTCESIFRSEEKRVARGDAIRCPLYAYGPHECHTWNV